MRRGAWVYRAMRADEYAGCHIIAKQCALPDDHVVGCRTTRRAVYYAVVPDEDVVTSRNIYARPLAYENVREAWIGKRAVNVRISADKNVERRTRFQDRALAYDGGTSTLGCDLDALPHGNALVRTSGLGRTASDVDIFTNHHAVV